MIQIVCDRCGKVTTEKAARVGVLVPCCGSNLPLSKELYWKHELKDLCGECLKEEKRKTLRILVEHPNLLPNHYLDEILDNIVKARIEVKECTRASWYHIPVQNAEGRCTTPKAKASPDSSTVLADTSG